MGIFEKFKFRVLLLVLVQYMKQTARMHPSFKKRLQEKNFTAQIKTLDNTAGRYIIFQNGKVLSKSGLHPRPDICLGFRDTGLGYRLLVPWRDQQERLQVSISESIK